MSLPMAVVVSCELGFKFCTNMFMVWFLGTLVNKLPMSNEAWDVVSADVCVFYFIY